jgi:M6 family metalloprotease-like protein
LVNSHLHSLVVFCNYPGDNFTPPGENVCLLNYWPATSSQVLPSWAPYVICPNTTTVWNPSITRYFKESSMGSFSLTGDVYPDIYIFEHTPDYYAVSGRKMGYAIGELLAGIDDKIDDWSIYDNFDPWDYDNDNDRNEPDGIVDFIFIVFRFNCTATVEGWSYTGIACLGGFAGQFGSGVNEYVTHDGLKILPGFPGSGCIGNVTNPWEIGVLTHEFGEHYTYGSGESTPMGSYHIRGGGIASAYDREQTGWNTTSAITPTSNTMGIELEDYVTTNDYIKIPRANGKTLYLENRRRLNYYSSEDNIIWKWNCNDPTRPIQSDSMLVIYTNNGPRDFKIESAFGNFDWQRCSDNSFKTIWYTQRNNFFFTQTPNRWGGISTFNLHGCLSDLSCNFIACSQGYWGGGGDFNTCFDVGYNDVYSPWSNPPLLVANQNDSLTIEIAGRNSSGNLLINVYFTNITDARPSKPQGLKHDYYYPENGWCIPKITWEHNLEPDMLRDNGTKKRYQVWRATEPDMSNFPNFYGTYSMIYEGDFNASVPPEYIDNSILEYDCALLDQVPPYGIKFPARYCVKAVDNTDKVSVFSDFDSTYGITPEGGVEDGGDNTISNKLVPKEFNVSQNYPNPFNPITNIKFDLPKDIFVSVKIYDLLGREIKTLVSEFKNAGSYIVSFNGSELSSGIYFYRIQAGKFVQVKRMVLIK